MKDTIKILLFLALCAFATGARGQIYIDSYRFGEAAPQDLLLDLYPGAAAAYSLRKLDKDYTGNCVQVRRSLDNATQNIGFSGNFLDTASLKTFVGAGSGFVATFYDQSGNGKDFIQTTQANQPAIMLSGALVKNGNNIAIDFDGSNDHFVTSSSVNIGTNISIFAAAILERNFTSFSRLVNGMNDYYFYVGTTPDEHIATFYGNSITWASTTAQSTNTWLNTNRIVTTINNGSDSQYINGSFISTRTQAMASFNRTISFGGMYLENSIQNFSQAWDGKGYELIIYPSAQTTNRANIESNMNSFYSFY